MKFIIFSLKKFLSVIRKESVKRTNRLDSIDKSVFKNEYIEIISSSECIKDYPYVLYSNQINIEQL